MATSQSICSIEGCERPAKSRGMCSMHYQRALRTGGLARLLSPTSEERFWAKVYFPPCEDDCWLWTAARNKFGYGVFHRDTDHRAYRAHRFAYELMVGPVPEGMQLDHLCRNRLCVKPAHLEPVSNRENTLRGLSGRLVTHCPHGHPYDDQNTYLYQGRRQCRTCSRKHVSESKRRKRASAKAVEVE